MINDNKYNSTKQEIKVFFRLHPSLNKLKAKKLISQICKKNEPLKIYTEIINRGSLRNAIDNSSICVFGESSYINYAISSRKSVFCCNNNHRYNPPIYEKNLDYKNITFLEPW